MKNEWFFKWHQIKRDSVVDIDSFDGRNIRYGNVEYSGSARLVYWDTIQRYLRKKLREILDELERQLPTYPLEIRKRTIREVKTPIFLFLQEIRNTAIEKDRILRGNGMDFPQAQDLGRWEGATPNFAEKLLDTLEQIFCSDEIVIGNKSMNLRSMMTELFTFVKKDGSLTKQNVLGRFANNKIITQDVSLTVEPGDHFLRKLPNDLVEDYIVVDPGFHASAMSIPARFVCEVRRSDIPQQEKKVVINQITAHLSGSNPRLNVGSTDNSTNYSISSIPQQELSNFLREVQSAYPVLPSELQVALKEHLEALEQEKSSSAPSASKIHGALQAIMDIAKGASGNLVAAGIVALASKLLTGG